MIQKFETTNKLGILPDGGRKKIQLSNVKNSTTVVVEPSSHSLSGSVSISDVSSLLDMPHSTVQKILRRILYFYPYKNKHVNLLQDEDSEVRKTFALQFLARMMVDVD